MGRINKELWTLGREVSFALPVCASQFRPNRLQIAEAAKRLNIQFNVAQKALCYFYEN